MNKIANAACFSGVSRRAARAEFYVGLGGAALGALASTIRAAGKHENLKGAVLCCLSLAGTVANLGIALDAARQLKARKKQATRFVLVDPKTGNEIGWTYSREDAEKTGRANRKAGKAVSVVEVSEKIDYADIQSHVRKAYEAASQGKPG